MAENRRAEGRKAVRDEVRESDPLDELARIIGYDTRREHPESATESFQMEAVGQKSNVPAMADLEDELMREFALYDAPRPEQHEPQEPTLEAVPEPAEEPQPEFAFEESGEPEADAGDDRELETAEVPAVEAFDEDDGTMPPLDFGVDLQSGMAHDAAETEDKVPASGDAVSDIAPDFAFSGPVPEIEDVGGMEDAGEPQFSGPVPDLNLDDDESTGDAIEADVADDDLVGELELSLGAVDLNQEDLVEPVSPFAEWKNGRLFGSSVAKEPAEPVWLPKLVLSSSSLPEPEPVVSLEPPVEHLEDTVKSAAEAVEVLNADEDVEQSGDQSDALLEHVEASADKAILRALLPWEVPEEEPAPAQAKTPPPQAVTPSPPQAVTPPPAQAEAFKPESQSDLDDFEFSFDDAEIEAEISKAVLSALEQDDQRHADAEAAQIEEVADPGPMPFDASLIGEMEETLPPVVGDLGVPAIPTGDGEPAVPAADFDYDIEAEMAELFAIAKKKPNAAGTVQPAPVGEGFAGVEDEFDRALEADILRSVNESIGAPEDPHLELPLEPASRRILSDRNRLMKMSAAALLVAFVGIGGAYFWLSGDMAEVASNGTPKIILADKSPIKTVPKNPGGKQVPNQDKAVYDRVSGETPKGFKQDSLITAQETPLNVNAQTLGNDVSPVDNDGAVASDTGSGDAASQNGQTAPSDARLAPSPDESAAGKDDNALLAPRKVKTMMVLPNGTVVTREDTVANNGAEVPGDTSSSAAPAAKTDKLASEVTKAAEGLKPTETPAVSLGTADNAAIAAAANADTAPLVEPPKPASVPVPTARPTEQPVNVVGTVSGQGRVVSEETAQNKSVASAAPAPAASRPPGTYVVQIASLPSEAEAKKSWTNLSAKFGSVIGGKSVDIKRADIAGKGTYYRVRVVAGSKDDAIALCQRYRAAGGSCLVSR